ARVRALSPRPAGVGGAEAAAGHRVVRAGECRRCGAWRGVRRHRRSLAPAERVLGHGRQNPRGADPHGGSSSVRAGSRFAAGARGLLGRDDEMRTELNALGRTTGGMATGLLALSDLRNGRYAQAAAALAALPNVKSAPPLWTGLVAALRLANRQDDALAEATALAARFPQTCEARVMLAALRFERREAAAAHRLADGLLAAA